MKRQKGLTLTGLIVVAIIVILLMLLAFKIVPVYTEYHAIERNLKAMAIDPKLRSATRKEIVGNWAMRSSVDDLRSLDAELIEVTKEGDELVLTGAYSVKVPLFKNISACFDFTPTSR